MMGICFLTVRQRELQKFRQQSPGSTVSRAEWHRRKDRTSLGALFRADRIRYRGFMSISLFSLHAFPFFVSSPTRRCKRKKPIAVRGACGTSARGSRPGGGSFSASRGRGPRQERAGERESDIRQALHARRRI